MKERYWTNLVTSLRYGQCVLVLGPEVPAKLASTTESSPAAGDLSYTEELTRHLASELEDDNRRVTGRTLAAVAQQYEDAEVWSEHHAVGGGAVLHGPRRTTLPMFTVRSLSSPSP